jgi:ParB-like nuclease family protein
MMKTERKCLECSDEYDAFTLHPEQRSLQPAHTIKIMRSMKSRGFIATCPIVVNDRFEILDGQHRFQAAKNLGIPFFYVVNEAIDVQDVREMAKANAAWVLGDYVTSYIRQGNDNFIRLQKLKEQSGLSWGPFMVGAFPGYRHMSDDIRSGKLVLTELKEAAIIDFISKFLMFRELFPKGWQHRGFVIACSQLFSHPQYNHKQMTARLEYQSTRLVRCPNSEAYLAMLSEIYNYRSVPKNVVDFSSRGRRVA